MRGYLRNRKMLKLSFRRAFVIVDNGALWVGDVLKNYKKDLIKLWQKK